MVLHDTTYCVIFYCAATGFVSFCNSFQSIILSFELDSEIICTGASVLVFEVTLVLLHRLGLSGEPVQCRLFDVGETHLCDIPGDTTLHLIDVVDTGGAEELSICFNIFLENGVPEQHFILAHDFLTHRLVFVNRLDVGHIPIDVFAGGVDLGPGGHDAVGG